MDWTQVLTIIVTLGAIFGWFLSRLDKDIMSLKNDLSGMQIETSGWVKHIVAMQAEQSKRTDELYKVILRMLEKGEK